ncbi:hypothetical protein [Embleya sp. NPDC020630]|uniref:hypothetical protein n=1 Tax=Embleya sp. NPDC020630 TaxID=3363979 RepID=UPI003795733B
MDYDMDYDPVTFRADDYTTVRDIADQVGVTEAAVRKWIERRGIKAVGRYPFPDNRKIYRADDLDMAEVATRLNAPERGNPAIAGWQRMKRAARRAA